MEQQSEKIDLNDLFIPISVLQNLIKETTISKKIIEEEHSELFFETLSGTGKIQLENNISYSGNMRFGIFDGGIENVPCTLVFSDGTKYEGDIHNNQITGHGKYTFVTGATYEGEVLNGLRHGYGEFTAADGTKYLGNWTNGLKNGMGNQINENMTYEGEWKDGIIDGNGKMKWKSGCIYEGEFSNNQINGNGYMIWLNKKEKYTGQWVNNVLEGKGIYTWYEGKNEMKSFNNRYVGEWKRGKRNGYGVFYYPNGSKYEGIWNDNKKDGFGVFTFQDGTEYVGLFKMDIMVDVYNPITLEKIEAELAASIQAMKPPSVSSPRKAKDNKDTPKNRRVIKKVPSTQLESIVETDQNVNISSNKGKSVGFTGLMKSQVQTQTQTQTQTETQNQTQPQIQPQLQPQTQTQIQPQTQTQTQSQPQSNESVQSKSGKKKISPYEKSLNKFEIYLNTTELNKISPEIGSGVKEIGNILLRYLSEIKRWYIYSFHPEGTESEEAKEKEKKDPFYLIPNCIYSNHSSYEMELKDLWRFLREVGTISSSFSIADFNQIFFYQYHNYIELFFVPSEYEGNDIYQFLYQKINQEKRFFADQYSIYTGYYYPKDPTNTGLLYLKESETKSHHEQKSDKFLFIDQTHEYTITRSIHNEQQIVLLRQFFDALIRCAYLKNRTKDIPFTQKFKEYIMECSLAKPQLKRSIVNRSMMSRLEVSFQQKEFKHNTEIIKARNTDYAMIDEFRELYKKQLEPIFNKLYENHIDNGNPNNMTIPYRVFYYKVIQKSKLFRELGIDKVHFADFITFFFKDKKQVSGDGIQLSPTELFSYIEDLFDLQFIFFEFCELVFFLTRRYILLKRLKEDMSNEHSLEVINHIWSLVKITPDKLKKRNIYTYPDNASHAAIETLIQEQKEYDKLLEQQQKEVERFNLERNNMAIADFNVYNPEMDEEYENSEDSELYELK